MKLSKSINARKAETLQEPGRYSDGGNLLLHISAILTATPTSEVLQAEWTELDPEKKVWTIPSKQMKAGHAHRIPLRSFQKLTLQKQIRAGKH